MGHSRSHKLASRRRILHIAAKEFRASGYERTGIASLMRTAGLSHGGFYGHFRSRADLSAHALHHAFEDGSGKFRDLIRRSQLPPIQAFLQHYLGEKHLNDPGWGCPVAALAVDTSRSAPRVKAAFTQEFESYIERVIGRLPDDNRRGEAIAIICAIAGAIAVARAIGKKSLRREILQATKDYLEAGLRRPAEKPGKAVSSAARASSGSAPRSHKRHASRR